MYNKRLMSLILAFILTFFSAANIFVLPVFGAETAPYETEERHVGIQIADGSDEAVLTADTGEPLDCVLIHVKYKNNNTPEFIKVYTPDDAVSSDGISVSLAAAAEEGDVILVWNSLNGMVPYGKAVVPSPSPDVPSLPKVTYTEEYDGGQVAVYNNSDKVASGSEIEEGAELRITVSANNGYTFKSLSVKGSETDYTIGNGITSADDGYIFVMPAESVRIEAEFKADTYDINTAAMTYGSINVAEKADFNSQVTITVSPQQGYRLNTLNVTGESASYTIGDGISPSEQRNTYTFTMPSENVEISASFITGEYTVENLSAEKTEQNHGCVSFTMPNGDTAQYGDIVEVSAVSFDVGYNLTGLIITGKATGEVCNVDGIHMDKDKYIGKWIFTMPDEDVTLEAVFTPVNYNVRNNTNEADKSENNGYIIINNSSSDTTATVLDTEIEITAVPEPYYELKTIYLRAFGSDEYEELGASDGRYIIDMSDIHADIEVRAEFTPAVYEIHASVDENITSVTLTEIGTGETEAHTVNVEDGAAEVVFNVKHALYSVSAKAARGYKVDTITPSEIEVTENVAENAFAVTSAQSDAPQIDADISISSDGEDGKYIVGDTLTAVAVINNSGLEDEEINYQWLYSDDDIEYENIGNAVVDTLVIDKSLIGKYIKVEIWTDNTQGYVRSQSVGPAQPIKYPVTVSITAGTIKSITLTSEGEGEAVTKTMSVDYTDTDETVVFYLPEGVYTVTAETEDENKFTSDTFPTVSLNEEITSGEFTLTTRPLAKDSISVIYDSEGGTVELTCNLLPVSGTVTEDDIVNITAEPFEGYILKSITYTEGDGESVDITEAKQLTAGMESISVEVVFEPIKYQIVKGTMTHGDIVINYNNEVVESGSEIPYKGEVTLQMSPDKGYETVAFTIDGEDKTSSLVSGGYTFTMPSGDVSVSAEFAQAVYTITNNTDENANGSIEISRTENLHYGDSITVTVTPDDGYMLDELNVTYGEENTQVEVNGNTFSMPDGNVTVTAIFKDREYTVSGTAGEGVTKVELKRDGDTIYSTVVTDGAFEFTGVAKGSYTVAPVIITGYSLASIVNGNINIADDQTTDVDGIVINTNKVVSQTITVNIVAPDATEEELAMMTFSLVMNGTPISSGDTIYQGAAITLQPATVSGFYAPSVTATGSTIGGKDNVYNMMVRKEDIVVTVTYTKR